MNRASFRHGRAKPEWERSRHGFTLIEMCIVLLIIALLFSLSLPSVQTAFTEQKVRKDSHQLALMVKTAMIQSAEQHRPYVIELTGKSIALHPLGKAAAESDDDFDSDPGTPNAGSSINTTSSVTGATDAAENNPTGVTAPSDVSVTTDLDPSNKLMAPDPQKTDAWIDMPDNSQWVFQPGELCPATHIRLEHGTSYIELTFNALTGNVENEASSIQ